MSEAVRFAISLVQAQSEHHHNDTTGLVNTTVATVEPVFARISELESELARLRAQLDGLADKFEARSAEQDTQSFASIARHSAFKECAAHVRGIVKVEP